MARLRPLALHNGLVVQQLGGLIETQAIYREVFVDDVYLKGGLHLPDAGGTIVDVGANIGMFVMRLAQAQRGYRILAIEPVPALFAALQANVAQHASGNDVMLENLAAGASDGTARFEFYPRATAFSTMHPEDRTALVPWLLDDLLSHYPQFQRRFPLLGALLWPFRRPLMKLIVWRRMRGVEHVQCRVRQLSALLEAHAIAHVDLLKIDVEGAELEVLRGIKDHHWPRIAQLALEVHDLDGRLAQVRTLLEQHGFGHIVVDPDLATAQVRLVYARR